MAVLPGTRIRDNGIFGTITDNPLAAGSTSFNSAELARLSAVAGNHALITLDPLREFGDPEIVMVTAHTAAATVATIQRGMFGTSARSHPQGTLWVHAACDNDFIEIVTSLTRPSDQYEGQFIYETDTNKLVGFGGVDWAPRDAGGQIGYAQVTAGQTGIGTSDTDLTGLSVVVTVGTNRRIKITSHTIFQKDAAAGFIVMRIREGAIQLNEGIANVPIATGFVTFDSSAIITPSAGSHTYKLMAVAENNTCSLQASSSLPSFILVEDIGAA